MPQQAEENVLIQQTYVLEFFFFYWQLGPYFIIIKQKKDALDSVSFDFAYVEI